MEYLIKDFEAEIKKLDPLFSISANPNNAAGTDNKIGLNNIFYDGRNYDLPPCPDVIKDVVDPNYRFVFRNGYSARFWSKDEILGRLETFLSQLKSGKLAEDYDNND